MASALLFGEITAVVFTANKAPGGAQHSDSISLNCSRLLGGDPPPPSVFFSSSSSTQCLSTHEGEDFPLARVNLFLWLKKKHQVVSSKTLGWWMIFYFSHQLGGKTAKRNNIFSTFLSKASACQRRLNHRIIIHYYNYTPPNPEIGILKCVAPLWKTGKEVDGGSSVTSQQYTKQECWGTSSRHTRFNQGRVVIGSTGTATHQVALISDCRAFFLILLLSPLTFVLLLCAFFICRPFIASRCCCQWRVGG